LFSGDEKGCNIFTEPFGNKIFTNECLKHIKELLDCGNIVHNVYPPGVVDVTHH
jgi:hypothetical protein